jgi:diacylglycerol kinase family enzyme
MSPAVDVNDEPGTRLSRLDVLGLEPPPLLIVNPHAGRKLGMPTNAATLSAVEEALGEAGLHVRTVETDHPRHATELARAAVRDGCTDTALGIMPLGSIMNMARTLCVPHNLKQAAEVIAHGDVLAMDLGRVADHIFLEAGGVGLAAGLFGYFNRLDSGHARLQGVLRATLRFLRGLGNPRVVIHADGQRFDVRAPMVTVSNAPFVGAAYALAPQARVDDGYLDVVIFRGMSVVRVLLHLVAVAGGRRLPPPPGVQLVRAQSVHVAALRRRPLPVHADGAAVGATPTHFEVLPAALRVMVGEPEPGAACAWERP